MKVFLSIIEKMFHCVFENVLSLLKHNFLGLLTYSYIIQSSLLFASFGEKLPCNVSNFTEKK